MEGLGLNDPVFWAGKRVLITGHTGFKGAWLCLWLTHVGAEVTGFALPPPTNPSLFESAGIVDRVRSIQGDVRNYDTLRKVAADTRPDIVVHMAAQALVRPSFQDPLLTYSTNVMGTANLLEAVRQCGGVRVVLNVTSDKCYENREWVWGYREDDPMGGHDPYSSSKGCAELVTAAFRNSFFSNSKSSARLASVRAGNVIGGGDWAKDRLIPDFMRAAMLGDPLFIRNPHSIRPWQFVLEPLRGYLVLARRLWEEGSEYAQAWNFGPNDNDARTVQWIAERITDMWDDGSSWELDPGPHPHEASYLKLDSSKARSLLGWAPFMNVEAALHWTVDWYKRYRAGDDPYEVSLNQIKAYSEMGAKGRE